MKNRNKLALLLSLGLLLPFAASAKTLEQSYIESCRKGPGIPTPIAVVSPHVVPEDIGQTVLVGFVVDTTGRPLDVTVQSDSNRALASAAVNAVKKWRFTPAQKNGAPVATRVILPIRVVDGAAASANVAMN
jgi:periplasmic protein TonB